MKQKIIIGNNNKAENKIFFIKKFSMKLTIKSSDGP